MSTRPRIVFFGTPDFAVPILSATMKTCDVVAVVTRPDEPKNRGHRIDQTPMNRAARSSGIEVITPRKLDVAFFDSIQKLNPDVAVLVAYGKIIPPSLLAIPKKGFVNIHASLLPLHRGASPIADTILTGDETTGVTLILLDEKTDHGPIIAQQKLAVEPHEHRPSLEQRCAALGATLVASSLVPYLNGDISPQPQDHERATYTTMLSRELASLHWSSDAAIIERTIRAYDPWPGTSTTFHDQPLKILDGRAVDGQPSEPAGTVINFFGQPAIVCGRGLLTNIMVQPANRKSMTAAAFANGHPDFIGHRLSSS